MFYDLVRMFNISVDQYIFDNTNMTPAATTQRRNTIKLMNSLTEKELMIVEGTIRGILDARNIN